jgi:hypothetical protein
VTRGKGVRPFGEHVGDLVPVYFAEITSLRWAGKARPSGCGKPRYFDGTVLPRTLPLSRTLSDALQRSR